ncbi:MAG: hypothetical protein U5Q03_03685 [Bacteroidota bacterium]|nr:hypothetical protein [Bacteroidota bacterium]
MEKYPLFSKKNIPSYLAVMLVWVLISVISSFLLYQLASGVSYWVLLIWAAITTMLGMMIMFGASVINLRKLSPGFKRLAAGEKNPTYHRYGVRYLRQQPMLPWNWQKKK